MLEEWLVGRVTFEPSVGRRLKFDAGSVTSNRMVGGKGDNQVSDW